MLLYLVRHGEASPDANDDERRLSPQGVKEVRLVAEFLQDGRVHIPFIYHSTKARAWQTAELLSSAVQNRKNVIEKQGITPTDPVNGLVDFIDCQTQDIMVVGHMPFLGDLVSLLVTGEEGRNLVAFPTACLVILEKASKGGWVIRGAVNPRMLQ